MARDSAFKIDEVRAAILHLMQLAACYEVRGDAVEDSGARRALASVIPILLAHRRRHLRQDEMALRAALVDEVAELYRAVVEKRLQQEELRDSLQYTFHSFGFRPLTTGQLNILEADRQSIRSSRGPVQAACERVGQVLGLQTRTLFKYRSEALSTRSPVAFGARLGGPWLPRTPKRRQASMIAIPETVQDRVRPRAARKWPEKSPRSQPTEPTPRIL